MDPARMPAASSLEYSPAPDPPRLGGGRIVLLLFVWTAGLCSWLGWGLAFFYLLTRVL